MTFTQGSVHSLTEIARLAGLPVSTTHRLTAELASWRLLERTECGHYRVGLPLRMIGAGGVTPPSVAERAPWVLEDLAAATRSRARLGVLAGTEVAYIEKQPGHRPVSSFCPTAMLPAHPLALGRALLAFSSLDTVDAVIAGGLRPYTRQTITSPDRFRRALTVTRLTRVAVTRWEFEHGVSGVAMPVFGPGGDVVGRDRAGRRRSRPRAAVDDRRPGRGVPQPLARAGDRAAAHPRRGSADAHRPLTHGARQERT